MKAIEANIKKLMCRKSDSEEGLSESSEKVAAIDSLLKPTDSWLTVLLISLGINYIGAKEIWNVSLVIL